MSIKYNKNYFNYSDIEHIFSYFRSTLENLQNKVLVRLGCEKLPLSIMQKTLIDSSSTVEIGKRFHMTAIHLKGNLDLSRLELIWKDLHKRMDIFSLAIMTENNEYPYAIIQNSVEANYRSYNLTDTLKEYDSEYSSYIYQEKNTPFDIKLAPLIRMRAVKINNYRSVVIIAYHQLLLDGWSLDILINTIFSYLSGMVSRALKYPQFLEWVRAANSDLNISKNDYKQERLHSNIKASKLLPFMKNISNISSEVSYAYCKYELSEEDTNRLKLAVKSLRVSLSTVIQALWSLLHSTIVGKNTVVFGIMASGRDKLAQHDRESMVGLCTHIVPLPCTIKGERLMSEYCQIIQEDFQNLHSDCPGFLQENSVNGINYLKSDLEIDFVLSFQNFSQISLPKTFGKLTINNITSHVYANFPMILRITPGDKLEVNMCYDGNIVDETKIKLMINSYIKLLKGFLISPKQFLREFKNSLKQDEKNVSRIHSI